MIENKVTDQVIEELKLELGVDTSTAMHILAMSAEPDGVATKTDLVKEGILPGKRQ